MGDMGDDFRAWKQDRIAKRAANRDYGAKYLADMGVHFEAKNDGAHLIVSHAGKVFDYWPGTGKFKEREGKWGRGIVNLMRAMNAVPSTRGVK